MNTDNSFKFLVLGIGDLFTKYYYNTSIILLYKDSNLLIDFPTPLRKVVYEASQKSGYPIDVDNIHDAILTHVHSDHSNGLETFGFYKLFIQQDRATVFTIPEVRDVLWENRLKASMGYLTNENFDIIKNMHIDDYFNVDIIEQNKVNEIGPFKVEIRRTKHFVPCFGLKITCNGRKLGYSGDTCFDSEHIDFLSDSDIIIHEANGEGHTPYNKLLELPEDIKKKMFIIHIQDTFDIQKSEIPVIEQGKIYKV